jgi:nucleoside-diphosphate-sugar epimerase
MKIDFDDSVLLTALLPDTRGRRVIYLAPPPAEGREDTRIGNFLQAITEQSPRTFVLVSTTGVYGDCKGQWIDEQTPVNPCADRAWRRVDAERRAQAYCEDRNIPLVILRVAGIYGPGKLPLTRIKKRLPVVCAEDSPYTNRIHAYDLVSICKAALLKDELSGIFNCTDGQPGTMYEYFNKVAEFAGLPRPPVISLQQARQTLSAGMLSYLDESRRVDNQKMLKHFNLCLQYPNLDAGLRAKSRDSFDTIFQRS